MINQPAEAFNGTDVRPIVDVLWAHWPAFMLLTPADVGMDFPPVRTMDFIRTIQELSDSGLVCYEALVIRGPEVRVIDAALTARGRAALASQMEGRGPNARLAGRA